jgi:hypothetical protein
MAKIIKHENKIVTLLDNAALQKMLQTLPSHIAATFVSVDTGIAYFAYKENNEIIIIGNNQKSTKVPTGEYHLYHEYNLIYDKKEIAL